MKILHFCSTLFLALSQIQDCATAVELPQDSYLGQVNSDDPPELELPQDSYLGQANSDDPPEIAASQCSASKGGGR